MSDNRLRDSVLLELLKYCEENESIEFHAAVTELIALRAELADTRERLTDTQHRNGKNIIRAERAEAELAALKSGEPVAGDSVRIPTSTDEAKLMLLLASQYLGLVAPPGGAMQAGMVMVPREPTPEMIQAMEDRQVEGASYIAENSIQYALWKEVYAAMISAAPSAREDAAK